MGIIRTALIGAAIYGAVKYLTKKDELTGRSVVDDLKDQAPEWLEKVKVIKMVCQKDFNIQMVVMVNN